MSSENHSVCVCVNVRACRIEIGWVLQYVVRMATTGMKELIKHRGNLKLCVFTGIVRLKRDGTGAETRFGLAAKRTSPFKSAGVSVQSTTGSRGVRISGEHLYGPCSDVQCKAAGYPLHSYLSPSLPLPCVTMCHQVPNALYYVQSSDIWLLNWLKTNARFSTGSGNCFFRTMSRPDSYRMLGHHHTEIITQSDFKKVVWPFVRDLIVSIL